MAREGGRRHDYIPCPLAQFKAFAQNLLDYVLARLSGGSDIKSAIVP
jgi:hypothetical protein